LKIQLNSYVHLKHLKWWTAAIAKLKKHSISKLFDQIQHYGLLLF